jgi:hypothetical protein
VVAAADLRHGPGGAAILEGGSKVVIGDGWKEVDDEGGTWQLTKKRRETLSLVNVVLKLRHI